MSTVVLTITPAAAELAHKEAVRVNAAAITWASRPDVTWITDIAVPA